MSYDLKKLRLENGLSQGEVAKRCQCCVTCVVKYEKGDSVAARSRKKIEDFIRSYSGEGVYAKLEDYKPAAMEVDALWKFLPPEIKFVAKDESGTIYGFKGEPKYNFQSGEWLCELGCVNIPLNVSFGNTEPEDSLVKRPYNYFEFIGKYGIFSDGDETLNCLFGKLSGITEEGCFCREGSTFRYKNFRPLAEKEKENLA